MNVQDRWGEPASAEAVPLLRGIRIITLAQQFPGPAATTLLADLGADVIMVEHPDRPDPTRRYPEFFEAANRNQRAVGLDLKSVAGHEALLALVRTADVFVEGFKPGTAARLGLSATDLRAVQPELVYASVSAYGHTGPLGQAGGHDLSIQARAGLLEGGRDEASAALPMGDLAAAMYTAIGILAALVRREKTAKGATLDIAMLDALVAWRGMRIAPVANGVEPAPYPPMDPGYGVFEVPAAAGRWALGISGEQHDWDALCTVLGIDAVGMPLDEREHRRTELRSAIQHAFDDAPSDIADQLADSGVVLAPVRDGEGVLQDPQLLARELIVPILESTTRRAVRQPIVIDGRPTPVTRTAPGVGEHTEELLREAGLAEGLVAQVLGRDV